MTDETAEDRPEEKKAESFLASFNRADAKLLIVTFAGTVAGGLATVMVVAVAIICVRWEASQSPSAIHLTIIVLSGLGVGISAIISGLSGFRRYHAVFDRRADLAVALMGVAIVTFTLLLLLGYAVGVK